MIKAVEKWVDIVPEECPSCNQSKFCNAAGVASNCAWVRNLEGADLSKPGILIIDDNPGIVSFLEDDLEELDSDNLIKLEDYNVFTFSTKYAAYKLLGTLRYYKDINIKVAIIDITLGGSMMTSKGNIKLTGVDIFEPLLEINPDLRYIFYTGNQMNEHIKTISEIMKKYSTITGKKITDNILFKTQLNMNDRRAFLYEKLFK